MEQERLEACQEALHYRFREPFWLQKALSHSSNRSDLGLSNERMEFLGDAILGMVVSEYLFSQYPDADEGELTAVKSIVVSQRTLADHGREIALDKFLSVGRGMSGVRRLPNSVVANVFEAIVAGIYLDRGIDGAREFILRTLAADIVEAERTKHETNYKSLLQQLAQRELACTPTYRVVEEAGPDHAKSFRVVTLLKDVEYGTGWGRNKKEAEQRSAKESLDLLRGQLAATRPPAAVAPPEALPEAAPGATPEPAPQFGDGGAGTPDGTGQAETQTPSVVSPDVTLQPNGAGQEAHGDNDENVGSAGFSPFPRGRIRPEGRTPNAPLHSAEVLPPDRAAVEGAPEPAAPPSEAAPAAEPEPEPSSPPPSQPPPPEGFAPSEGRPDSSSPEGFTPSSPETT